MINAEVVLKKTWQIINQNTKKRLKSNQTIIYENDNLVNKEDVPNKFINYFSNIANSLVSEIPQVDVSAESYLNNSNYSYFLCPQ